MDPEQGTNLTHGVVSLGQGASRSRFVDLVAGIVSGIPVAVVHSSQRVEFPASCGPTPESIYLAADAAGG